MFISDEAFAQLHRELMLEHNAKLRMITDNNKLYRILQEIKELAEVGQDKYHNGLILAKPILDLINKAESEE